MDQQTGAKVQAILSLGDFDVVLPEELSTFFSDLTKKLVSEGFVADEVALFFKKYDRDLRMWLSLEKAKNPNYLSTPEAQKWLHERIELVQYQKPRQETQLIFSDDTSFVAQAPITFIGHHTLTGSPLNSDITVDAPGKKLHVAAVEGTLSNTDIVRISTGDRNFSGRIIATTAGEGGKNFSAEAEVTSRRMVEPVDFTFQNQYKGEVGKALSIPFSILPASGAQYVVERKIECYGEEEGWFRILNRDTFESGKSDTLLIWPNRDKLGIALTVCATDNQGNRGSSHVRFEVPSTPLATQDFSGDTD